MENRNETPGEKPKGNMLQNENREDEATAPDSSLIDNGKVANNETAKTRDQNEPDKNVKLHQDK